MRYTIPEAIIEKSFYLSVWLIQQLRNTESLNHKEAYLRTLEEGTLGREIVKCMRAHNLHLVPGYESHDLKHTLLGYEMTVLDEIRMQAFMLGNGNWSVPSIAILLYGIILLPIRWKVLWNDYNAGRRALPVKTWSIDHFADKKIDDLRKMVFDARPLPDKQYTLNMNRILQYGSLAVVICGAAGMAYSFPHLWSSVTADLIGAGLAFIAGAILVVGGLISLAVTLKSRSPQFN